MKSILTSTAKRKAQKPDILAERPKFRMCLVSLKNPPHEQALQDSELPEILQEQAKEECRSKMGCLSHLSLLTCSGAQQEDEDGLLTKVLNGKVSLFTPNRTIQPLIAVAFSNKQHVCFWNSAYILTFLPHSLLSHCCPESFYAKSSCPDSHFIAFNSFILSQLNLV